MIEAKEKFRAYLLREGLNFTRPREIILDAFCSAASHLSAKELHLRLRGKHPQIGYATVYRALKLFAECGIAEKRNFGDKVDRYEPTSGQEYHDHLICIGCGSIVEFQEPRIKEMWALIGRKNGFFIESHNLELQGLCTKCSG